MLKWQLKKTNKQKNFLRGTAVTINFQHPLLAESGHCSLKCGWKTRKLQYLVAAPLSFRQRYKQSSNMYHLLSLKCLLGSGEVYVVN